MAGPFILLYAHEVHGASVFTLGLMGSAETATGLLTGIPLGRLADKLGRKKVLYILSPAIYLSFGLLVFVRSSLVLAVSAGFWGLAQLSLVTIEALGNELVPLLQIGRWKGVLALFRGLVNIPAPLISGLLRDNLGPGFIFLLPIVLDLGLRLPLLSTMPETLNRPACECMA
jgi:MFS family permease